MARMADFDYEYVPGRRYIRPIRETWLAWDICSMGTSDRPPSGEAPMRDKRPPPPPPPTPPPSPTPTHHGNSNTNHPPPMAHPHPPPHPTKTPAPIHLRQPRNVHESPQNRPHLRRPNTHTQLPPEHNPRRLPALHNGPSLLTSHHRSQPATNGASSHLLRAHEAREGYAT